ncbi:permease [Bacillus pseudomycoides]|uniref:permease n=2 Tax=Bacillus pseudomycoides TaxID=64104 RepID=UPI000BED05AE|nr:permease [Bacillus pseudomycoides]PDY02243.1 permease [Bacillus pseudomycoides]PEK78748.1 permease [Bacillus pseudomycoides]PEN07265.1 permease [Bacillus pseudomycoides]PGB79484.1 permease [Bacillus pseudomycoides]
MDEMKPHKKKRLRKKKRNRKTFKQIVFQCWINIKKFFKVLFVLVLFGAFWGFCYYIFDKVSNREFTVHLVFAFVICFVLSYILGHIISKVKDWNFSNADVNFNGDIGGCLLALILFPLFLLLFGVTYFGVNYIIYKITGNKKFNSSSKEP